MTSPFDDLIAQLDAAKADVARSVRKSRAFIAGHGSPADAEPPPPDAEDGLLDPPPPAN